MFLVVFRNRKHAGIELAPYDADAARMEQLASEQPGYISFKSYAADDDEVVAISEWQDEASASAWGRHAEHLAVQGRGREAYYQSYTLFVCADPCVSQFERNED